MSLPSDAPQIADPSIRIVHLGLGHFFRAHQAWFTQHADDGADWGIAAFTGRDPRMAGIMESQGGRFTVVIRSADEDTYEVIDRVHRAHPSSDSESWYSYFASPALAIVTITVTEPPYLYDERSGIDWSNAALQADLERLRADRSATVETVPARIAAGLMHRREADAGPVTILPCDNLPDNGQVVERVIHAFCDAIDPSMAAWLHDSVSFVSSVVDRITPAASDELFAAVKERTGFDDHAAVICEPYSEWVMAGHFSAGRPAWESAGARFVDDIKPFEQRKLWLLNAAHTLLAYAGLARGHATVSEAMGDPACVAWMRQLWQSSGSYINLSASELEAYTSALEKRFSNDRIVHRLAQISLDGSQKLPIRIVPCLLRDRSEGRMPEGALRALAAWVWFLRARQDIAKDADLDRLRTLVIGALPGVVRELMAFLDPALAEDPELLQAVTSYALEFEDAAAH